MFKGAIILLEKNRDEKLWAISPIDGRYKNKLSELEELVSESALLNIESK